MARGVLRASRRPDGRGVYCSGLGADVRHPSSDGSWACRAAYPLWRVRYTYVLPCSGRRAIPRRSRPLTRRRRGWDGM
eukprot:213628-Prymnesium_polylepis.1